MPDTPEGVAFALMSLILEQDAAEVASGIRAMGARQFFLGLYLDCYHAAIGIRGIAEALEVRAHH